MNEAIRLLRLKRYQQALQKFLSLDVESSEYPELSYYLGLCYTHLGKFDEALLYLEQVVASDLGFPHIYQSRMILGYIYSVTGRYRLAEFEFARLLEEGYESAKVYAALAYALYEQGREHESVQYLENALRLDPDNANALNSLGFILAEEGTQLDRAYRYCKRAVSLKPENAAYLDSLGWTCYRLGRLREAQAYLKRAAETAPKNREIASHLREVVKAVTI